jgi:hypothetical protein
MKAGIIEATCIAVVSGASMAVFAQATERPGPPTNSPPLAAQTQQQPAPSVPFEGSVTLVGCVQREADYRRAQNAGRGGAAGTGAGVGNEFVLVSASTAIAGATPSDAPTPGAPPAEPVTVGTPGRAGGAYELTGPAEGQLEQYVGRRVEIVGKMKSGPTAKSDKAPAVRATVPESTTGRPGVPSSATASPSGRPAPPAGGVDLTGQDLHLREFEVVSVREATGSCTPVQK